EFLNQLPDELDRAAVRAAGASAAVGEREATAAFIAVMAWGFGSVGYGPFRTRRILASTPDAASRLRKVAELVQGSSADSAYRSFARSAESRLQFLGPSFGTKFLHFCQPANRWPRALILDEFVASWLREHTGEKLDPVAWNEPTYRRYLRLMHGWSEALGVEPDELEYCIFQAAADSRASQWGAKSAM